MGVIETSIELWKFNRDRTRATLDELEKRDDAQEALGWRPAPGRAHIAWQLMHIAVTEELFATDRLLGTETCCPDLVPRFRGGSTPDDEIPALEDIRTLLETSRGHLLETISRFSDDDLATVPEPFKERGWSLGMILQVVAWHEAHHQGQAHLTMNLWKAAQAETA